VSWLFKDYPPFVNFPHFPNKERTQFVGTTAMESQEVEYLWHQIFVTALEKLNVHVFVTTHSKDCVEGFHAIWESQEDEGTLYRLDNDPDDGVSVMPYNCELVSYAVEKNREVR
jgi:hypothetical protein